MYSIGPCIAIVVVVLVIVAVCVTRYVTKRQQAAAIAAEMRAVSPIVMSDLVRYLWVLTVVIE